MYIEIMLTLIFLVLLWIAIGLQVIASSIVALGKLVRFPSPRKLRQLERNTKPLVLKLAAVKAISQLTIRYFWKKVL